MREGTRRYQKALARQNRGYSAGLSCESTVDDGDWVSQFDAAERLGVSMMRIGFLIQNGRLEPVHSAAGQAGVLRATVEREAVRRADAGPLKRVWLLLMDTGRSLVNGI